MQAEEYYGYEHGRDIFQMGKRVNHTHIQYLPLRYVQIVNKFVRQIVVIGIGFLNDGNKVR